MFCRKSDYAQSILIIENYIIQRAIPISAGRGDIFLVIFMGQQTISMSLMNPHLPEEVACLLPSITSRILKGQSDNFLHTPGLPCSIVHWLPSAKNKEKPEVILLLLIA